MKMYLAKRKAGKTSYVSSVTMEKVEVQLHDKTIVIRATSREDAERRLAEEWEGEWELC
jgi:hypothetical protein